MAQAKGTFVFTRFPKRHELTIQIHKTVLECVSCVYICTKTQFSRISSLLSMMLIATDMPFKILLHVAAVLSTSTGTEPFFLSIALIVVHKPADKTTAEQYHLIEHHAMSFSI